MGIYPNTGRGCSCSRISFTLWTQGLLHHAIGVVLSLVSTVAEADNRKLQTSFGDYARKTQSSVK